MALDILNQDIIIDESTDLQDDDINPSGNTNPTLLYLLSLDDPGGLSSPEVAHQANFVQATASASETISGIVLAQNASGTPFSTTVGVNSGIRTVDGNYVWLFQDPTNPNVVIGVIGTSDPEVPPAADGPLAFAFGLDPTSATNADLYLVQYVPLFHPDPDQVDERIDLTDHVFASVTGTSVLSFLGQNAAPGNHDFYVINSSTDASKQLLVTGFLGAANATANVSTQGFGIGNQSINPTETLQCDFITGGNLPAGSGSQIQYGSHLNNVTQAGFTINQVTPSNPNLRVDITIRAFDNTGNEQGSDFFNGTTTTAVDITSIKLTGASGLLATITADGTYATASGNVTVTGLTGTGNAVTIAGLDNITTVDFTTATQMDRLTVTGVDTNEGCDITEFHFTSQSSNAHTEEVGSFINFDDSGPTLEITAAPVVGAAEVIEASGVGGQDEVTITSPAFNSSAVDGKTTNVSYALSLAGAPATGLLTTDGNHAIMLVADSDNLISGQYDSDGDTVLDSTAFTVTLSGTTVTLTSLVALEHDNTQDASEDNTLDLNGLINVVATVTVTDGDEDVVSQESTSSGLSLTFNDTDPTITAAFDADPGTPGIQTPEHLANTDGATASGTIGYDMTDKHAAAAYGPGTSDFVDTNAALAGIQINLTGTVDNAQNPAITQAVATRTAETETSATFNFSFHYDKDPITIGVQDATAGGTLVFDKLADTYTFTLTDVIEGFSFDVLHTSELVAKAPTGNTGHPLIVAEQLTPNGDPDPFFIQFTANTTTQKIGFGFNSTGDGAPSGPPTDVSFTQGGHDMVTNANEDWVSATQSTNGVAGDTIQKGELLTLRFFQENILSDVNPGAPGGGTERLDPTTKASGIVIKFDGIGNSEDLVVILDLKDANGNEVTRAVNVQNSDLIKGNANVPAPYNTEFTLDNNDALLIIEQNDYTVAGETYLIQGVQIMQSANGLTGDAINLIGATGANGGSSAISNLTAFDTTDNDVLKIVDIGFVQNTSGTISADLDFAFQVADADADQTDTQHILVDVS